MVPASRKHADVIIARLVEGVVGFGCLKCNAVLRYDLILGGVFVVRFAHECRWLGRRRRRQGSFLMPVAGRATFA